MKHMTPGKVIAAALTIALSADAQNPQPVNVPLDVRARGTQTFYVDPAAGRNQLSIFSESELDDFAIVCNVVSGRWQFDPGNVEHLAGRFVVRVTDLTTGIGLRDRHLREPEWLDAAEYPEILIAIDHGEQARKLTSNSASMVLVAKLTLHGVIHDVRIPCTLTYLDESPQTRERTPGDLMRLRANFEIRLSDFSVRGPPYPDFTSLRVADKLTVKAAIFGSTTRPAPPPRLNELGPTTRPAGRALRPSA
jgi:polyisoprenoid-binding protein YceI